MGGVACSFRRAAPLVPRRRQLARAARTFAEETFDLWRNGRRLAGILRSTRRAAAGEAA
jgi:hypothetical protein